MVQEIERKKNYFRTYLGEFYLENNNKEVFDFVKNLNVYDNMYITYNYLNQIPAVEVLKTIGTTLLCQEKRKFAETQTKEWISINTLNDSVYTKYNIDYIFISVEELINMYFLDGDRISGLDVEIKRRVDNSKTVDVLFVYVADYIKHEYLRKICGAVVSHRILNGKNTIFLIRNSIPMSSNMFMPSQYTDMFKTFNIGYIDEVEIAENKQAVIVKEVKETTIENKTDENGVSELYKTRDPNAVH